MMALRNNECSGMVSTLLYMGVAAEYKSIDD